MAQDLTGLVPQELAGARFDVALAQLASVSRTQAQGLIRQGQALLCGRPAGLAARVRAGDEICWQEAVRRPLRAAPEALPLAVVFEDEHLLVLDKPRGQVVHPSLGHAGGTVVNALLHHVGRLPGDAVRPGIVHRLDRDTSGLMLVAKSEIALQRLQAMLAGREVHRIYDALVEGAPRADSGTIDAAIGRDPRDRKRFAVRPDGRGAVTHFAVRRRLGPQSWLRLRLETGRTHQIRVHLAHRGWPVVGDPVYGRGGQGQLLHAVRLSLAHPVDGRALAFFAPWPEDMRRHVARLARAQGIDPEEVQREIARTDPE